jgi:hypothetical protein
MNQEPSDGCSDFRASWSCNLQEEGDKLVARVIFLLTVCDNEYLTECNIFGVTN